MPPVIVAVAAGAAAYAAGATVIAAITIAAAAAALYTVATMDIPSTPGTDPSTAKQTIRTPNQPCRRIFGTAMVGGVLSFAEEYLNKDGFYEDYESCTWVGGGSDQSSGGYKCHTAQRWVDKSTKYLHLVVVLAAHEVESILEVYFGDELQTEWDHDYWKINVVKGDQTKISDLPALLRSVPSWTDKMIGKGIAFVHVALRHSATHFPNGIPSIKCLVKGTKLKTPFFNGFGNNAAACIYHYLRYQFGATEKMINADSFRNEFNVSNEKMRAETPQEENPAIPSSPIRYAIDGAFDYDESHQNVLKKMLSACGGNLIFTNGQYYLQVAAYRGPVSSKQIITLDNLNGPLNISPDTPLSDRVNTIQGQYLDPFGAYLQADFTPVTNATYIAEDGNEERTYDADFEYVLNKHQANRLANIILKDNRYGLTITVPMNLSGFKFNAGLLVGLDDKTLGYDDLEFRITNWKLDPKGGVVLSLKQTAADIYDDSTAPVSPKPGDTDIPNPKFCYPVERLTFEAMEDDGVYDGILWWSHPDLANIREFEVVAAASSGEIFRYNAGKDTEIRLRDMRGVQYNITVTAYNVYGAPSTPITIVTKVGDPKPIATVRFEPDNFEITITPTVSGVLPQNTRFLFFRANTPTPDKGDMKAIGEGVVLTDVGLIPNTVYNYFIQPVNGSAMGEITGPYATKTTDNPDDIYDFIKDEIPGTYTWVVYAVDAFGQGISKTYDPAIHKFEGRAYNKSVQEPSLNPLDYTFFRIGDFISDAEQDILNNLAQGKTPDGTDDLVGELAVKTIAAQEVNALKVLADWITAKNISAGAITAEKIAVTVVSPVNNYSEFGGTRGWTVPQGTNLVEEVRLDGRIARTLKVISGSVTKEIKADKFSIDHNSIYELRFSIYCDQSTPDIDNRLGVRSFDKDDTNVPTKTFHPVTLDPLGEVNNLNLWEGSVIDGWRHMVAYIIGANADINAAPKSLNVNYLAKLTADVRKLEMFTEVVGSGNTRSSHFYSPSIIKVGSGLIVANEIRAGARISAPVIEGGRIIATEIQSDNWKPDPATGLSPVGYKMFSAHSTSVTLPDGTVITDPDGLAVFQDAVVNGHITAKSLTFINDAAIPPEIDNKNVDTSTALINYAKGATFTSSSGAVDKSLITDGNKSIGSGYLNFGVGDNQYVQADLGEVKKVAEVRAYYYAQDGRYYLNPRVDISDDGTVWKTVFTSSTSRRVENGIYGAGAIIPTVMSVNEKARYVRLYTSGNSINTSNHLYELELMSMATQEDPYSSSGWMYPNQSSLQIKSSNYQSGVRGWAIDADGNAELNNVTVRGNGYFESGYFKGTVYANRIEGDVVSAKIYSASNKRVISPGDSQWSSWESFDVVRVSKSSNKTRTLIVTVTNRVQCEATGIPSKTFSAQVRMTGSFGTVTCDPISGTGFTAVGQGTEVQRTMIVNVPAGTTGSMTVQTRAYNNHSAGYRVSSSVVKGVSGTSYPVQLVPAGSDLS